jgi:DNA recombination protein RmuC
VDLESRQKAIDATLLPLKEQLIANAQLVKDLSEKREGDSKALGEQLKQIAELQQRASAAAQSLSSAMRDNRQRGQWGEVSLKNVMEMAGMEQHISYISQLPVTNEDGDKLRPDCVIRLPGQRFIALDSKVPMNGYLDALDPSKSDADRAAGRLAHAAALKTHVRALVSRDYGRALCSDFGTAEDMTIMYIPIESALIAAFETDQDLFDWALRSKIIITTPATLLALLRTCALQWTQHQINENARNIGEQATVLLERLKTFTEHFEKMKKGLDSANNAFDAAVRSFNARLLPAANQTAQLMGNANLEREDIATISAVLPEKKTEQ